MDIVEEVLVVKEDLTDDEKDAIGVLALEISALGKANTALEAAQKIFSDLNFNAQCANSALITEKRAAIKVLTMEEEK